LTIQLGCQTYTWQMSYDKYAGKIPHMLDIIQQSGFSGVEAEVCMLGTYYEIPSLLAEELEQRNLQLPALTLALPWANKEETDAEKQEVEKLLTFLQHFPGTSMVLVQLPGTNRNHLRERQNHALAVMNSVARRASDRGVNVVYHPNSAVNSLFRTKEDYQVMFDGLDTHYLGYAPDSGHIANGGMDVVDMFKQNLEIIRHVHFKDISADKQWRVMGEGVIDHLAIVKLLKDSGYNGWIMVEEESVRSETDPDGAVIHNGGYVREHISVLL
jgi:inosose dehydratase